jgi:uncharacterized protein YpmS
MKGGIGMKHFKKILLIPLFLITACLIMTGCAKTAVQEETENKAAIEAADVASIQDFTDQQFAQQLVKANYEDFQSRVDSGEVVISRIFDNDLAQSGKPSRKSTERSRRRKSPKQTRRMTAITASSS